MEGLRASNTSTSLAAPPTTPLGTVLHTVSLEAPLSAVCLHLPLVDGVSYAEGGGGKKGEARENTAHNCYMILHPQ